MAGILLAPGAVIARLWIPPATVVALGGWYGAYDLTDSAMCFVLGITPKKLEKSNENMGMLTGFGTATTLVMLRERFSPPADIAKAPTSAPIVSAETAGRAVVAYAKEQLTMVKRFPFRHYGYSIFGHAAAFSIAQRVYNKTHLHVMS
jgi:hypothetical protein